ncbi:hypothetical protein ACFLQN_02425 [Candidatus Aenigmatarchaeota archaeon]
MFARDGPIKITIDTKFRPHKLMGSFGGRYRGHGVYEFRSMSEIRRWAKENRGRFYMHEFDHGVFLYNHYNAGKHKFSLMGGTDPITKP